MKKGLALIPIFCLIMAGMKVSTSSGQQLSEKSYYVVIGAYSTPKNAIEFIESAKKNNYDAQFSINPLRKLFYVFVMQTDNAQAALEEAKKIRKDTPYYDTWVFNGKLGEETSKGEGGGNPVAEKLSPNTKTAEVKPNTSATPQVAQENPTVTNATANQTAASTTDVTTPTNTAPPEAVADGSKSFFFKIYTVDKEIPGDVDVMDIDKTKPRKVASYPGNQVVSIKPPNKSGNISLVCEVFGYRKIEQPINFNDPKATDGIVVADNKITVPFNLVRLKTGDIAVMYNVFFFKDAAIMRPESRYEITSLLEMMQENPKCKIRINGHTNGNSSGKIISMGDSKNFFSLKDTKEGHGSAKKLSEERAKAIQGYLISQGISPERMQVKAWGGKRPIYAEDSQQAQANVRVEIEILED